jgi:hypothetical protein
VRLLIVAEGNAPAVRSSLVKRLTFVLAACGAPPAPTTPAIANAARPDAAAACAKLHPDPSNAVIGSLPRGAMPLAGTTVDGRPFDLASLRGHVVLVAFESSWARVSQLELATIDPAAFGSDAAVVRVDSDDTIADVPARPQLTTLFDRAQGRCSAIGALTHAWGVDAVPETFLVDRAGNLRFHFVDHRDWSSADAVACVQALAGDRMAAITTPPADAQPATPPCVDAPPDASHVIAGTIELSPRVPAGATIFIAAKPAAGGPPLAAARVSYAGGGAVAFHLGDDDSMLAGGALSGDVIVTATYDQDGDIMTKQPGDLVGRVKVTVPATGVTIAVDQPR